jgi:hypothetical protein
VLVARVQSARGDVGAGVLLGLSASVNPVMALQGAGAFAVAWRGSVREAVVSCGRMIVGAFIGLLPYAYPPLVAARASQTLVWGAPHDVRSWIRLITASDFRRNVSASPGTLAENLVHLTRDLAANGALLLMLAGLAAAWVGSDRARARREVFALAIAFGVGVSMIAANVPYLPHNPDYGGYVLVPIALALGAIVRVAEDADGVRSKAFATTLAAVAIGASGFAWKQGRPAGVTRALATEVLASAPAHALIVLGSDHVLFPALYLQRVEGLREDVTLLNPGWASASWAWTWVRARDRSLNVDLSPGLGGDARLTGTLRAREAGRAVLAESPMLLRAVAPGPVCIRGLMWSSGEGCIGVVRWFERTRSWLARHASDAHDDSWDARTIWFTARSLGDAASSLGCAGAAGALYDAGLGSDAPMASLRCTGVPIAPPPGASFLDITRSDLEMARARIGRR